jgi:hypothetical protein
MARRLFSHNAQLGITTYAHVDEDRDQIVLEKVVDEEHLLETAKRSRDGYTSLDRMGDGLQKVAEVPMHIYATWLADGRDRDPAFVRNWLNDPANRRYRTRLMKV